MNVQHDLSLLRVGFPALRSRYRAAGRITVSGSKRSR